MGLLDAGKAQPVAQPVSQTAQPVAPACSFDGSDCRQTGCCARDGSKCYRKNDHWASCDETCLSFSRWSHHHHHWVHTSEPVWDCTVLTEPVAGVAVYPDNRNPAMGFGLVQGFGVRRMPRGR